MPVFCCSPLLPRTSCRAMRTLSPPLAPACGPSNACANAWSPKDSRRPSTTDRSRLGRTRSRKGDVEQKLMHLACSDPPEGRCHWTLSLLCDELVALGLVPTISTETVRQALKKTTLSPGSLRLGASRPRSTPSTSGGWKT